MAAKTLVALCALVLVAGCPGPPNGPPPTTTTTTDTSFKTLDPTPPSTTTTTATGNPRLTITIGTARLDGGTTSTPWSDPAPVFNLSPDKPTHDDCKAFGWRDETSVPISVVEVGFSNSVVGPGSFGKFGLCESAGAQAECEDFTFPPPNTTEKVKCGVPVRAQRPPGDRAQTVVTLTFRAACSSAVSKPCDDPRVVAAGPSSARPVFLEWRHSETLTTVWHPPANKTTTTSTAATTTTTTTTSS